MAGFPFRFGMCTSPTFGSVALDVVDLPHVQADMQVKETMLGGVFTSVNGTKTIDRLGMKRSWAVQLGPWRPMVDWWPVLHMRRQYTGPWIFFDQTTPNLLTGDQRLLISWTNAAGTSTPARLDGFASLAVAGVTQMGPTTAVDATVLVPVTAGSVYSFGFSAYGPGAWTVTSAVGWYSAALAALSTTTLGTDTKAGQPTNLYLDGTLSSSRISHPATAPASAAYAQLRLTCSGAAVDVGDPCVVPGLYDAGRAVYVVNIDDLTESHGRVATSGLATLALALSAI